MMRSPGRKQWITIGVLGLACLVFVAAGVLLARVFPSEETQQFVCQMDAEKVDGISIDQQNAGFSIVKNGDQWQLPNDADIDVDAGKVSELLNTVCELPAVRELAAPMQDEEYGLDQPAHTIELRAGTERTTVEIGDYNTALQVYYVRANGHLFLVRPSYLTAINWDGLAYAAGTDSKGLRASTVQSITVNTKGQEFVLRPYDPAANEMYTNQFEFVVDGYFDSPIGADSNGVYQMVGIVQEVQACEQVAYVKDSSSSAQYGLDQPVMQIDYAYQATTYSGERYDANLVLSIGSSGNALYAAFDDNPVVYKLTDEVASLFTFLSTPTAFMSTRVMAVTPEEITGLTIRRGSKVYEIEIEDPAYEVCIVNGEKADSNVVKGIVTLLTEIQCYGFAKETNLEPSLEVEIRRDYPGYERMQMTFAKNGTDFYNVSFGTVDNYLINKNYYLNLDNMLKDL